MGVWGQDRSHGPGNGSAGCIQSHIFLLHMRVASLTAVETGWERIQLRYRYHADKAQPATGHNRGQENCPT